MTKKKSFITLLLAFCLIVSAMFMLTACGSDKQIKLSNDSGFEIVGGGFEEGSVLNAKKVESSSADATQIFEKLTGFGVAITDKTKAFIYDIFVSKDDKKLQPNGKVKVNIPMSTSASGYKVYHIKDDNTVEELTATFADGIISFETSSFSYYVFVATGDVNINPTPEVGDDDTPTLETIWNNAINDWQKANNIRVEESISSPDDPADLGAQIMVYQLDGTAYNEDGYFEKAEESKNKGKGYYIVKEGDKYSRYESYDEGATWYKTSAGDMTNQLKRTIYGCSNLEDELIDFSYANFNYDSSTDTYKYKANENIAVKLEFVNGSIDNIIITRYRTSYETTFIRTITFGNAVVEVPTTNIIDQTAS